MNPTTLYDSNSPADHARTARMVAEREGWRLVEGTRRGFGSADIPCVTPFLKDQAYPVRSNEASAWLWIERIFNYSATDVILALLACYVTRI